MRPTRPRGLPRVQPSRRPSTRRENPGRVPQLPIPEIARLGRTLRQWRDAFLGYFTTNGASNGGTEAINGLIELHRRIARGFRNRENYRLRMLLIAGASTNPTSSVKSWQTRGIVPHSPPASPPRIGVSAAHCAKGPLPILRGMSMPKLALASTTSLLLLLAGCSSSVSITSVNTSDDARLAACKSLFGEGDWASMSGTDGFYCKRYDGSFFSVSVDSGDKSMKTLRGRDGVSIYFSDWDDESTARAALDRLTP
jgi:hypothetical protein